MTQILAWRPMRKNSLVGFASIKTPGGVTWHGVSIHTAAGKAWAALPSKEMVKDGVVLRDAAGKIRYTHVIEIDDKNLRDKVSAAIIVALRAAYPDALP